jgi:MOSC domain-containing protein YiiM
MNTGSIHAIYIAPQAKQLLQPVLEVRAVPGQGLEGDRYFQGRGSLSRWPGAARQVSLIERETLEAVWRETGLDLGEGRSRRNLVTAGVRLNDLKGCTFRVGGAVLRGVGLCLPCGHLERLTSPGAFAALKGRGGLRAEVLVEGVIRVNDPLEVCAAASGQLPV